MASAGSHLEDFKDEKSTTTAAKKEPSLNVRAGNYLLINQRGVHTKTVAMLIELQQEQAFKLELLYCTLYSFLFTLHSTFEA